MLSNCFKAQLFERKKKIQRSSLTWAYNNRLVGCPRYTMNSLFIFRKNIVKIYNKKNRIFFNINNIILIIIKIIIFITLMILFFI